MGDYEGRASALLESLVKYHPLVFIGLTPSNFLETRKRLFLIPFTWGYEKYLSRKSDGGQCLVGSLTGAVAS